MTGPHILGNCFKQNKIGLPEDYFLGRDAFLDVRAPGMIEIDASVNFGWEVKFVVQSHDMSEGMFNNVVSRPIKISKGAYIGSFAILYNCEIGEGAVVAIGSVVRSQNILPWTMAEGNPARPIKKYNHATRKWEKI